MMLNEKQDCIDSVTKALERASRWRKSLVEKFPEDSRNERAAATLDRLTAEAANLTDEQWLALKPHFGWASFSWRNGLNQTARQVGFQHRAGDFDYFAKMLVQNLSLLPSVAA